MNRLKPSKKTIGVYLLLFIFAVVIVLLRHSTDKEKPLVIAADVPTVTADFGKQIAIGSPLVFGGAHAPPIEHQNVYDKLAEIGVTSIRRDFFIESSLPENISLEDYRSNKNNIQSIEKWNWNHINNTLEIFKSAKKRGMKVIAIVSYSPKWLTSVNKTKGIPVDWDVYKDIVAKLYTIYRPYIDYIEIWNEPDWDNFIDISGTGLTKEKAYIEIYTNVLSALSSVEQKEKDKKIILIGGPVLSDPRNLNFITEMSKNIQIKQKTDFISFHSYNDNDKYIDSVKKTAFNSFGKNLPIYISEWNRNGDSELENNYTFSSIGIPYFAERIFNFLENNIYMASYFATIKNDQQHREKSVRGYGIYRVIDKEFIYFPLVKAWYLLSHQMALGKGESKIFASTVNDNSVETLAFINSKNMIGFSVVNYANNRNIKLKLINLPYSGLTEVKVYVASTSNNPEVVYCSNTINNSSNSMVISLNLEEYSVTGINLGPASLSVNNVLNVLGISTSNNCIF